MRWCSSAWNQQQQRMCITHGVHNTEDIQVGLCWKRKVKRQMGAAFEDFRQTGASERVVQGLLCFVSRKSYDNPNISKPLAGEYMFAFAGDVGDLALVGIFGNQKNLIIGLQ